jgi:hypothetical protein
MNAQTQKNTAISSPQVAPFYPPMEFCQNNTPWEIRVYRAASNPKRWLRFNQRASSCYAAMGLVSAGELPRVDTGQFDTYFAEATVVSRQGRRVAVGGIKIHAVDNDGEVPLYAELADHLNVKILRSYVTKVCSPNLCHGGGLWIDRRFAKTGLAADLARAGVPIMLAMEATWCVAMTHTRIIDAWSSLGWHKLKRFPNFFYPDSRYNSAIILGSIASWPPEVRQWASEQVKNSMLIPHAPNALFTVQPLRTADGSVDGSE